MQDFLIVGFGVAGASLAKTLKDAGADVAVINHEDPTASSLVAAGLVNPITGRAFSLSWRAGEVFPFLHSYYEAIEKKHTSTVFHKMPVYRVCASMRELNEWSSKAGDPGYKPFVLDGFTPDPELIDAPWGTIGTGEGGYVNIPLYLDLVKKELGMDYIPTDERIDLKDISVEENLVQWKDRKARRLILCDGYLAYEGKFFRYLPFTPMKGEILELDIPGMYTDRILIRGGFVVPFSGKGFLAGATYDWQNIDTMPTERAAEQILGRLGAYIKAPLKLRGHRVGIRPAVRDRKPLIGSHPEFRNVFLFNGMGSKGTSLSPYLASIFTGHLLHGKPIPDEVDLNRFQSGKTST